MPSIAEILTQNSNDKVEIKSQVNLNGQAFKTFKQFIEQINIYEVATKIEELSIGGDVGIYGNINFGIYGASKYGNTAETGFILGSTIAGILGTNKLGSTESELVTIRVIPPNRTFTERFVGIIFIDGSSTATISGDTATFTNGQTLISEVIYQNEETISNATLSPTYISGDGNISSFISSDNGISFNLVTQNVLSSISVPGEKVKYKLVASGNAEITKMEVIIQ